MHPTVHSKDTTGSSSRIPVDEGPLVDPADVEALRKKVTKLDVGERAWLAMVGSQCAKAGYSVNLGQNPTKRRWTIGRAMLHCARIGAKSVDDYDQVARQLLAVVLGTDAAQFLNVTLGQCFAALTIDEASLLGDLAAAEDLTILVTDDGLELSGPAVERAQKIA